MSGKKQGNQPKTHGSTAILTSAQTEEQEVTTEVDDKIVNDFSEEKEPSLRIVKPGAATEAKGGLRRLDPWTTLVPFIAIAVLCIFFITKPEESTEVLGNVRGFLGDSFGSYYLVIGLGIFLISLWISFSRIGKIRLGGQNAKPKFKFWTWGAMVFTCGLAADILFYSFCEWIYYSQESHVQDLGATQEWAQTFTLFHWGPIPWAFYAVLAAAFGFMLHVRGKKKQKFSEACRPILGKYTDKAPGKAIDVIAVVALIAGTATTFSVATPLLSAALSDLFGIESSKYITIAILAVTCCLYTFSVMKGLKGISMSAQICMYLFIGLLSYVFLFGGQTRYIVETGLSSLGNMVQNFFGLSTYTDALRENNFPQNWTIFYWAYWMVWCVASPFFMGSISKGRTVKQIIMGTYIFGLLSTFISFIILGNYGMGQQLTGGFDAVGLYEACGDLYQTVIGIIHTLPVPQIVLIVLIVSMIAFYSTSFDSITLVASQYSYKEFKGDEEPSKKTKLFWAMLLILLPIALIFSESSMANMQSVSIIAAFPIGLVIILIVAAFVKDAKKYANEIKIPV